MVFGQMCTGDGGGGEGGGDGVGTEAVSYRGVVHIVRSK